MPMPMTPVSFAAQVTTLDPLPTSLLAEGAMSDDAYSSYSEESSDIEAKHPCKSHRRSRQSGKRDDPRCNQGQMLASALAKFTDNSAKDQIPTAAVKTLRNASTGKAVLGNEGVNKIMLEIAASFKKDGSSKAATDVNPLEQLDARTKKFFLELQQA